MVYRWWRANQMALISHSPRRFTWMVIIDALLFILGLACLMALPFLGGWIEIAASTILAVFIASGAFYFVRDAQTFRSGWTNGRLQMLNSMGEAMRRGMTIEEWVVSEMDRDLALYGMTRADLGLDPPEETL